jgi:aarF domain-containing kinase
LHDFSVDNAEAELLLGARQVLKSALHLARKHEVVIDSSYAALVVGVCVIVGFATALDPAVNLIDAATPAFFINDLTGRIAGRLYT